MTVTQVQVSRDVVASVSDHWRDEAACRDQNPELFFPVGSSGPALDQIEQAKAVCAQCPVRRQCLQSALLHGEDEGIWGGLTAQERRELLRDRSARAGLIH